MKEFLRVRKILPMVPDFVLGQLGAVPAVSFAVTRRVGCTLKAMWCADWNERWVIETTNTNQTNQPNTTTPFTSLTHPFQEALLLLELTRNQV